MSSGQKVTLAVLVRPGFEVAAACGRRGEILIEIGVVVDGAGVAKDGPVDAFERLEASLGQLERSRPEGLTSAEILDLLGTHGVLVSEATLRKYVQLGLLPRSVRVGRKGKHLGSRGLYPVEVVRRIAIIKALMADRFTIEEIRQRLVFLSVDIDKLEAGLRSVLAKLGESQERGPSGGALPFELGRGKKSEMRAIERLGRELIERLRKLDRDLCEQDRPGQRQLDPSPLRQAI